MNLNKRVAVVTGAAQGIGAEIANVLAGKGVKVILTDINEKELSAHTKKLLKQGRTVENFVLDVSSEADVVHIFNKIKKEHGKIDILINNAAISPKIEGKRRETINTPLEEWEHVLAVNLTGAFLCTREVIPVMKENSWGRIVNISSQAGRTASKIAGSHYAASKSGMIGFTRTIALEYGKFGITANCIAPGRIETQMAQVALKETNESFLENVPVGRQGTTAEVAALVLFICSNEAGYMNGSTIDINGGSFMS